MARYSHMPTSPVAPAQQSDPLADLTRLLGRLQQTILRADADRERRLRTSELERRKVATNVEFAQTLLTRIEQDALRIKVHARRQELQTELSRKRELLEQVADRLKDLGEMPIEEEDDSSEGEDLLGDVIVTPSESMESTSAGMPPDGEEDIEEPILEHDPEKEPILDISESQPLEMTEKSAPFPVHVEPQQTTTSSAVRARGAQREPIQDSATTSGSAFSAPQDEGSTAQLATTEAILDHQRREQDAMIASLSKMSSALKAQNQAFSQSLEEGNSVLKLASDGLDKNTSGLDAASRRMGTLRKMTEGKGFFARLILYGIIYGLMLLLVVVVFALPKLRF